MVGSCDKNICQWRGSCIHLWTLGSVVILWVTNAIMECLPMYGKITLFSWSISLICKAYVQLRECQPNQGAMKQLKKKQAPGTSMEYTSNASSNAPTSKAGGDWFCICDHPSAIEFPRYHLSLLLGLGVACLPCPQRCQQCLGATVIYCYHLTSSV